MRWVLLLPHYSEGPTEAGLVGSLARGNALPRCMLGVGRQISCLWLDICHDCVRRLHGLLGGGAGGREGGGEGGAHEGGVQQSTIICLEHSRTLHIRESGNVRELGTSLWASFPVWKS